MLTYLSGKAKAVPAPLCLVLRVFSQSTSRMRLVGRSSSDLFLAQPLSVCSNSSLSVYSGEDLLVFWPRRSPDTADETSTMVQFSFGHRALLLSAPSSPPPPPPPPLCLSVCLCLSLSHSFSHSHSLTLLLLLLLLSLPSSVCSQLGPITLAHAL